MSRVTFRQWSMAASLGPIGFELLRVRRAMDRARGRLAARLARDLMRDAARTGTGIISMGADCTPIRIPPERFFNPPDDERQDK